MTALVTRLQRLGLHLSFVCRIRTVGRHGQIGAVFAAVAAPDVMEVRDGAVYGVIDLNGRRVGEPRRQWPQRMLDPSCYRCSSRPPSKHSPMALTGLKRAKQRFVP